MSHVSHAQSIQVHDLGLMGYDMAYEAQMSIHQTILEGAESTIVLCEHPSVITCGRLAKKENILASEEEITKKNVTIRHIDRGGDITLHAPGQLMIYCLFDLKRLGKDLHLFMRNLEEVTIGLLARWGITASRHADYTGVWVGSKKIASLGIGVKKWVSYHGIGLNVNTDLKFFDLINPCGISAQMTSIQEIKGAAQNMEEVKAHVAGEFSQVFHVNA